MGGLEGMEGWPASEVAGSCDNIDVFNKRLVAVVFILK
jgi:hypothetical protein